MRNSYRTTPIPTTPITYTHKHSDDESDGALPGDIYHTTTGELAQAIQVKGEHSGVSCEGCMWNGALCKGFDQSVPDCTMTEGTVIYVPAPHWDAISHTTIRIYDDGTWAYVSEVHETGNDETVSYFEERVPALGSDDAVQEWLDARGHKRLTHR